MPDERSGSTPKPGPAHFPIAHVHWTLPPVTGGVETYLAEFTRELATRGHPVTLFTGKGELNGWRQVNTVRLELLDLDCYASRRAQASDEDLADELAEAIGAELLRRGINVVHGHNLHHFTPVPALALDRLHKPLGLRLHHTYHSFWEQKSGNRSGVADDAQPIDPAVTCRAWPGQHVVSRYLSRRCDSELDIRTVHTYLGVAGDRYDQVVERPADTSDQVILLPARLVPEKGAVLAVTALRQLRDEGHAVRLMLTTPNQTVDWDNESEDFRAQIQDLVVRLELIPYVDFRAARFDEMPGLYAQSDIVIYPSVYPEPLGIAPLEAAAAGRPVIVTRIGGLPETVVDGVTGYVVPPLDRTALTDSLRTLLKDRALARRMGEAGRAHVLENFALDAHVDRMVELYRA